MALNIELPDYKDNPDIIRDLKDIFSQLDEQALTTEDKDELLIRVANVLDQANEYTDNMFDTSGILMSKQLLTLDELHIWTTETLSEVLGEIVIIPLSSIDSIAGDLDLQIGNTLYDQSMHYGRVIDIQLNDVYVETISYIQIVSYGTERAFDCYSISNNSTLPPITTETGNQKYGLTPYDSTHVKVWTDYNQGDQWHEVAIIPISQMSMFTTSQDSKTQYFLAGEFIDFSGGFEPNNFYTKNQIDEFNQTQDLEIAKKENTLIAGNNIIIDRTDTNNPVIHSSGGGEAGGDTILSCNAVANDTGYDLTIKTDKNIEGFNVNLPNVNNNVVTPQINTAIADINSLNTSLTMSNNKISDLENRTVDLEVKSNYVYDTGWKNITLNPGMSAVAGYPARYRRIGKMVQIVGAIQGTFPAAGSYVNVNLSTLSTDCRQSQQTEHFTGTAGSGGRTGVVGIRSDGIIRVASRESPSWLSICVSYFVD